MKPGKQPHRKRVHRAKLLRGDGSASALCSKVPRRINLKRATWTISDHAVTCPKCLAILAARKPATSST